MSSITPETVKKISKLACVHVSDRDVEAMAKDLDSILQWVTQLQKLDISGVELHQACSESMPENDDVVTEIPQVEQVLENAPSRVDSWFSVPKMIGA